MSKLPEELTAEILSRVPAKPLIRLKCVCKTWNSIISDPQFAKLQLKRAKQNNFISCNRLLLSTWSPQSLDFEAFSHGDVDINTTTDVSFPSIVKGPPTFYVKILGSCDGLVCLLDDYGTIFLWNPTTREYRKLPNPKGAIYSMFLHGIGYDFSTDDYRVVLGSHSTDHNGAVVEVYPLKTDTWRKAEDVFPIPKLSRGSGVFWNGALYWLKVKESSLGKFYVIFSFDIVEEKFKEILSLPDHFDPSMYKASLAISGNFLCAFCECKGSCFEALVLNVNNGVEPFWTKLFNVPGVRFPGFDNTILCITKNGEVVLECDGWKLFLYNPKEGIFRGFEMNNDGDSCELELYVESLVSPNVYEST